jgi:hypothetical protein
VENCGDDMKLRDLIVSYLKRKWWYLTLLILSTIYILNHKNDISQLKEFNAMNLIFIIWLVLMLLPLFSEMEFFGIKLKKEVEKAKTEIKENLNDLRMQIIDLKISNSNVNTINVGNGYLPSEQKLKELEGNSEVKIDIPPETKVIEKIKFEISEESTYLFKIRTTIEKALTDLCEKTDYNGHKSIVQMAQHLNRRELIAGNTVELISQITKITNRGIHGEIVSNEYIDFINRVFPALQKQLDEANTRLHYCTCPKCKNFGYSLFENVCPKCGFTSDDY